MRGKATAQLLPCPVMHIQDKHSIILNGIYYAKYISAAAVEQFPDFDRELVVLCCEGAT
jgi:hypothetical protein